MKWFENFMDWAERTKFWEHTLLLLLYVLAMYGLYALGGKDIPKECSKVWIP